MDNIKNRVKSTLKKGRNVFEGKPLEIVMLGNTSVGKTSMLAALSKNIKQVHNICGVSFSPHGDSITTLDDAWNDLTDEISSGGVYLPVTAKLPGSTDFVDYHFDLCFEGESKAKIDFVDTKGAFIRDMDGSGLFERTASAFGVFCVVDASVLMECDPATNLRFNRPGLVSDLLGRVFARKQHPKFVAFVLTKCETYMRSDDGVDRLKAKFQEVYCDSIKLLQQKRVNSYAMAIQTLGCVRFKELCEVCDPDTGKSRKLPSFIRAGGTSIRPQDCELPLIVAMKNALWEIRSNRGVWNWIKNLLGLGDRLDDYIKQLEGLDLKRVGGAKRYYEELASDY